MKRLTMLFVAVVILLSCNASLAQEKPLNIKGLYIGMDAAEARNVLEQLLGLQWKFSSPGKTINVLPSSFNGNSFIFGNYDPMSKSRSYEITGDYGFAIIAKKDDYYDGYISIEPVSNKVIRISFSGRITDLLFSAYSLDANSFAPTFWQSYNMPDFNWIPHGWMYTSPQGYVVTIKIDKSIDIKKEVTAAN